MLAELLVLVALPVLLVAAGLFDLASFTIPNSLQALMLCAFFAFALVAHLAPAVIGWHLLAGLAGLAVGFVLFALGYVGGGDAKLFACVALWLGFADLAPYTIAASLFGGLLTFALLLARNCPLPSLLAGQAWAARLHDARSGVPYGVALAAGAFVLLPHTEIFRLAAGV
jgi:prepilin peptidase CpaA